MQAQFNTLPLLSVKPGLDSSLANVSRELETYFSSAGSDHQALKNAQVDLHRIGGVLRMLSLTGLVVFCAELEKLLQELGQAQAVDVSQRDIIRRALFGLTVGAQHLRRHVGAVAAFIVAREQKVTNLFSLARPLG